MTSQDETGRYDVAIVSCDIVGHSRQPEATQVSRVTAINAIVGAVLRSAPDEAVWASGGDGGHVVLSMPDRDAVALDLVARLRGWAADNTVPFRVSVHTGTTRTVVGADGRTQLVGEAINDAAWLLDHGTEHAALASEAFVTAAGPDRGATFHDPRLLPLRNRSSLQRVFLLSTPDDRSAWPAAATPVEDRERLTAAIDSRDGWDVVYFAKRILQINHHDLEAEDALAGLGPTWLTYANPSESGLPDVNPYLGYLDGGSLREVVRAAQLVERRAGEYICRRGDAGDTMFVILRGRVGVFDVEGGPAEATGPVEPAFVHGGGEIVGELAFALNRDRTADLVALEDTALLSLSAADVGERLPRNPSGVLVTERTNRFIGSRVLEHVSHNVPYLLGGDRSGPLNAGTAWQRTLKGLQDYSALVPVTAAQLDPEDPPGGLLAPGVAVLAGGRLRGGVDGVKVLDGDQFPLVWVDVPGVVVLPRQEFTVESAGARILHLDAAGLARLQGATRDALQAGLLRAAARCFHYDGFISYTAEDRAVAERWQAALAGHGLRIYLDDSPRGLEFPPRLLRAIVDSRAVVALVSAHVMVREPERSWVRREIRAHRRLFSSGRVLPVRLAGGRPEEVAPGFAPIEAQHDEPAAIAQVADLLRALRDGPKTPPYALRIDRAARPGTAWDW